MDGSVSMPWCSPPSPTSARPTWTSTRRPPTSAGAMASGRQRQPRPTPGIPTVTVPMGTMADIGMPVGLTFAGRADDDNAAGPRRGVGGDRQPLHRAPRRRRCRRSRGDAGLRKGRTVAAGTDQESTHPAGVRPRWSRLNNVEVSVTAEAEPVGWATDSAALDRGHPPQGNGDRGLPAEIELCESVDLFASGRQQEFLLGPYTVAHAMSSGPVDAQLGKLLTRHPVGSRAPGSSVRRGCCSPSASSQASDAGRSAGGQRVVLRDQRPSTSSGVHDTGFGQIRAPPEQRDFRRGRQGSGPCDGFCAAPLLARGIGAPGTSCGCRGQRKGLHQVRAAGTGGQAGDVRPKNWASPDEGHRPAFSRGLRPSPGHERLRGHTPWPGGRGCPPCGTLRLGLGAVCADATARRPGHRMGRSRWLSCGRGCRLRAAGGSSASVCC